MGEEIANEFWLIVTALLLGYIGLNKGRQVFCGNKESNEQTCKKPCKSMMAKDFVYMAVIFGILAVVMMSFALYRDSEALNYFSFASTLSSVILSVIAIIMTIHSEQRSEAAKGQLEQAAQAMAEMNVELNGKIERIKEYSETIEKCMGTFDVTLADILSNTQETKKILNNKPIKHTEQIISEYE